MSSLSGISLFCWCFALQKCFKNLRWCEFEEHLSTLLTSYMLFIIFYVSFLLPSSYCTFSVKFQVKFIIIIACFYSMGPITQDLSLWEYDMPLNKVWAHQYAIDELWNSDLWLNKEPPLLYKINRQKSEGQNANWNDNRTQCIWLEDNDIK